MTILLCTHNGVGYLQEQLDSINAQSHTDWRLVISDDGSVDDTRALLSRYKATFQSPERVDIREGPRQGSAMNFLSLATDASIQSDYFAFCDQDDIWYPDKLERAIASLRPVPSDIPAIYCSRTRVVASNGQLLYFSPNFAKPPSFRNALVQSLAGGNTMVMNRPARALLVGAGPLQVVTHDWWTYLLVSGCGGVVLFDPVAALDYRQHRANQIGANQGSLASFKRFILLFCGQQKFWNDVNTAALTHSSHLLTTESQNVLTAFCAMRSTSIFKRLKLWRQVRPYRQTRLGDFTLLLALLTNKL